MSDCIGQYWNAREAARHGFDLTKPQRLILRRSDPLVHKELQFSERYNSISFSSTLADGAKGCRFKQIQYSHPYRWVSQVVPMSDAEEDEVWYKALMLAGKLYDTWGLGGFATKLKIIKPHPDRYWCNEATDTAILVAKGHWAIRPNSLRPDERHPVDSYFACQRNIELDRLKGM